jgi:hypothetical protein
MSQEIKFVIRYTGGVSEHHKLNLYDASKSLHGLARALAISTHAMTSGGEIRHRVGNNSSIPNVEFYLHPGQRGSFIEVVSVVFNNPITETIGAGILGAAFWDMIAFSWRKAAGLDYEPTTRRNRKIVKDKEDFIDEIIDALEKPLQDLHTPILQDSNIKIEIKKPRGEVLIELNIDTLNHVFTIEEGGIKEDVRGNVTKYNIISGYGRFYDEEIGKTIPFNLSRDVTTAQKGVLTSSLHYAGQRAAGKIEIDAKAILDKLGQVKRYVILSARSL